MRSVILMILTAVAISGCYASHLDTSVSATLHGSPACGDVDLSADAVGWMVLDGRDCLRSIEPEPEMGLYREDCGNASASVRIVDGAVEGVDVSRTLGAPGEQVYCSWSWRAP